jgi:hypothetical protein
VTDLVVIACIATLAAVVDAIIVRRRLAVMRKQYEIERAYCLHADARVTGLESEIEALRLRHATLQGLYAERTRELLAHSHWIVTRVVAWKRNAGGQC